MSDATGERITTWMENAFAVFNDPGRLDEFVGYFAPEYTNFYLDHGLLNEQGIQKEGLQAFYDAGFKPNLQVRHANVQSYDGFAVFTGYAVGTIAEAGGNIRVGTWRFSAVLVPHGDGWQIVHNHWSSLET